MLSRQFAAVVVTLSLCAGTALADARRDVNRARDLYYEGRYKKAIGKADDALKTPDVVVELQVLAHKYKAFSYFLLGEKKEAKAAYKELLTLDPSFKLDRLEASPEFVGFFGNIRGPAPEVIEAQPADTATAADPTVQKSRAPAPKTCDPYLCAVPFGVGQLANGEPLKAGLFATAEVAFLATNIALYWINRSEFERRGYFPDEDKAKSRHSTQQVFAVLFVATAIGGALEAYLDR